MLKPSSTTTTNLMKARDLIANPADWCKGSYYNDRGQRCAIGALRAITWCAEAETADRLLKQAASEIRRGYFPTAVNDVLGHAAVMTMYARAIELSLADQ